MAVASYPVMATTHPAAVMAPLTSQKSLKRSRSDGDDHQARAFAATAFQAHSNASLTPHKPIEIRRPSAEHPQRRTFFTSMGVAASALLDFAAALFTPVVVAVVPAEVNFKRRYIERDLNSITQSAPGAWPKTSPTPASSASSKRARTSPPTTRPPFIYSSPLKTIPYQANLKQTNGRNAANVAQESGSNAQRKQTPQLHRALLPGNVQASIIPTEQASTAEALQSRGESKKECINKNTSSSHVTGKQAHQPTTITTTLTTAVGTPSGGVDQRPITQHITKSTIVQPPIADQSANTAQGDVRLSTTSAHQSGLSPFSYPPRTSAAARHPRILNRNFRKDRQKAEASSKLASQSLNLKSGGIRKERTAGSNRSTASGGSADMRRSECTKHRAKLNQSGEWKTTLLRTAIGEKDSSVTDDACRKTGKEKKKECSKRKMASKPVVDEKSKLQPGISDGGVVGRARSGPVVRKSIEPSQAPTINESYEHVDSGVRMRSASLDIMSSKGTNFKPHLEHAPMREDLITTFAGTLKDVDNCVAGYIGGNDDFLARKMQEVQRCREDELIKEALRKNVDENDTVVLENLAAKMEEISADEAIRSRYLAAITAQPEELSADMPRSNLHGFEGEPMQVDRTRKAPISNNVGVNTYGKDFNAYSNSKARQTTLMEIIDEDIEMGSDEDTNTNLSRDSNIDSKEGTENGMMEDILEHGNRYFDHEMHHPEVHNESSIDSPYTVEHSTRQATQRCLQMAGQNAQKKRLGGYLNVMEGIVEPPTEYHVNTNYVPRTVKEDPTSKSDDAKYRMGVGLHEPKRVASTKSGEVAQRRRQIYPHSSKSGVRRQQPSASCPRLHTSANGGDAEAQGQHDRTGRQRNDGHNKTSNLARAEKTETTDPSAEGGRIADGASSSGSSEKVAADAVSKSPTSKASRSSEDSSSDDSVALGLIDEAAALALQPRIIKPLSSYWENKVNEALAVTKQDTQVTPPPGVRLSRHDIGTVLSATGARGAIPWLNDEVINLYLNHMVERKHQKIHHTAIDPKTGKTISKTPHIYHAFTSHWFNSMDKWGHEKVRTWGRRAKMQGATILGARKIFAPVNPANMHWTLLVISPQERSIEHLDSLGGSGAHAIRVARAWLAAELGDLYVPDEWTEVTTRSGRQSNGSDCGVFTVFNALAVIEGFEPSEVVRAADMPLARRQLVATLINGGLSGDFDF